MNHPHSRRAGLDNDGESITPGTELHATIAEDAWHTLCLAMEHAVEGISRLDAQGRYEQVNKSYAAMLGYQPRDMIGMEWLNTSHREDREIMMAAYYRMQSQGKAEAVARGVRKDGSILHQQVVLIGAYDDQQNFSGYYCFMKDVSERQQAVLALREYQERVDLILKVSGVAVWDWDIRTKTLMQSDNAFALYGIRPDLINATFDNFLTRVHPEDRDAVHNTIMRAIERGTNYEMDFRVVSPDGTFRWIRGTGGVFRNETGQPVRLVGLARDITERKKASLALEEANRTLSGSVLELEKRARDISLLAEMGEFFQACLTASDAYSVAANIGKKLFPFCSGEMYLLNAADLLLEQVAAWGLSSSGGQKIFSPDACWALRRGQIHRIEDQDTGLICGHIMADPHTSIDYLCVPMMAQGKIIGVMSFRCWPPIAGAAAWTSTLLSEVKQRLAMNMAEHVALAISNLRLQETLRSQAIRDPLTGLFNRRYMEESLSREVHRATRNKNHVGIIMMDLDHFKRYNDTFGHGAGDSLLKEVGDFLVGHVREEDIACRYGGEEFTLIMPSASLEATVRRSEDLHRKFTSHFSSWAGSRPYPITISIGVAVFPDNGSSGKAVLDAADAALYGAKQAGRNRIQVATNPEAEPVLGS